jgi:hypothetical protein
MGPINIHELARVVDYPEQIREPRRTEYGNIRHKSGIAERDTG